MKELTEGWLDVRLVILGFMGPRKFQGMKEQTEGWLDVRFGTSGFKKTFLTNYMYFSK